MNFNKAKQENSRFSSLVSEKSNTFTKKNNSKKRYDRNNNYNNQTFYVQKPNNVNIDDQNDFPDMEILTKSETKDNTMKELSYLEKCNKKKEEDKDIIYTKLPKYWRGHIWTGPVFRKQSKPQGKCWDNYKESVRRNPPSSIIIPGKILYSRDSKNWYNSFQETFTEQEWLLMEEQKHQENMKKMQDDFSQLCDKWEARYERESWQYYQETGELDGWALAKREQKEYDEYCKQFEIDEEDDNFIDSEDEYITD